MVDYVILCEKPSAAKNFAKALGGTTGIFADKSYEIVASQGHLLQTKPPEMMVDAEYKDRYASWALNTMPWNLSHFSWEKQPISRKDRRTNKKTTTAPIINKIASVAKKGRSFVIATDVDPSGEGQLIGWEIINAIGWKKPVYRMNFTDEAIPSIQKSFRNMVDISEQLKDGEYLKSEARNRWDFASIQLTRIATSSARHAGYDVVCRQGRLKSVMVRHVFEQEEAIKTYVRKPYYEVKFKDENGHIFGRKVGDEIEGIRFDKKLEAEADKNRYSSSPITDVQRTRKKSAPGKLLDLSTLSAMLATKGFSANEVLSVYQKMYEEQIVSYPRTEDKFISNEQFNEMLPLIDKIASVVGVNRSLLTHRKPRKSHVKDGGAHGANRPGVNVPTSLKAVGKFGGACAEAIYVTLAKNFLSMFGEDYVYDTVTARLAKYPTFITSFSVPVEMNYKLIFNDSDSDSEDSDESSGKGDIGQNASPFIHEGSNKKPPKPTMKWLMAFLEKHDVGTGATRTSTLADISSVNGLLAEKKGTLSTTEKGKVTAVLAENTFIASAKVTKQLFDAMKEVGTFKRKPESILGLFEQVIKHDMPLMINNAKNLKSILGEPSKTLQKPKMKPKVEREITTASGEKKKVVFGKTWGTYTFSDAEIDALCEGKEITIEYKKTPTSDGLPVIGHLGEKSRDDGTKFWGFDAHFVNTRETDPNYACIIRDNQKFYYKRTWKGYAFSDQEVEFLSRGETIRINNGGVEYQGKIEQLSFKGKTYYGFDGKLLKSGVKDATHYYTKFKGEDIRFKHSWGKHSFTDAELKDLADGKTITFDYQGRNKTGSLQQGRYKGAKYWAFTPDDFKDSSAPKKRTATRKK